MKINKSVETPQGTVTFEGTLTPEEVNLVVEIGLNVLLANGAIPFTNTTEDTEEEDDEGHTLQ